MPPQITRYTEVALTSDLFAALSDRERAMVPLLIDAARHMDAIYWQESFGSAEALLASITDPAQRRFVELNYGPWDRLRADAPLLPDVGKKPRGAQFYPSDMTREEFEAACAASREPATPDQPAPSLQPGTVPEPATAPGPAIAPGRAAEPEWATATSPAHATAPEPATAPALKSPYTVVRRGADGHLEAVPYHIAFASQVQAAAASLRAAAALAEDPGLRRYLEMRAAALLDDEYEPSDRAWLDMKDNGVDIVIGPIEDYEDRLFGYKTAHEALVLIKDREWSARLARYATLLPQLQRQLPVPDAYKREQPGSDSDLNAYDVVFCAGDANAGAKPVAVNLPNDERIQLTKGTRRVQLKNVMRAKFDLILVPIADRLIAEDQRRHVTFDAFFQQAMFHEVAHGLGIKDTLDGAGTVREALREQHGALEEEKADVLSLFLIAKLHEMGELADTDLLDNYVTCLASLFRSVRFGAEAHGRSTLAQFEHYRSSAGLARDDATGTYRVDMPEMREAVTGLAETILRLQGDGDYRGVVAHLPKDDEIDPTLQADLERLASVGIPTDITFAQGMDVLRGAHSR